MFIACFSVLWWRERPAARIIRYSINVPEFSCAVTIIGCRPDGYLCPIDEPDAIPYFIIETIHGCCLATTEDPTKIWAIIDTNAALPLPYLGHDFNAIINSPTQFKKGTRGQALRHGIDEQIAEAIKEYIMWGQDE